jgi:acetyltransferase-like isoleucine patch superfamily enzyme
LTTLLENDVWIGDGVIILAVVRIGRGAVVAASSVVAGVPAACVKRRLTPEDVIRHETTYPEAIPGKRNKRIRRTY